MISIKTVRTSPADTVIPPARGVASRRSGGRLHLAALAALSALAGSALIGTRSAEARPTGYEGSAPSCFLTGGGALEICREGSEAEGVLIAPAPCAFVRGVQILRLARSEAPGPLQAVFQGQTPA
ncbi:hypothetical protein OMR07_27540, partial [Methylobacterium organophilum]|nr:hypothetical protein [Methylobacterium organophilum]